MPVREIDFYFRDEMKDVCLYELPESGGLSEQESRIPMSGHLTCDPWREGVRIKVGGNW